jgi:hypothetical protein
VAVPVGEVPAFAATLAMRGSAEVRPLADEIAISRRNRGALLLSAEGVAEGVVGLQCSWKELRRAVDADPYVSAPSSTSLRFGADPGPRLPQPEQATLSCLLRRIALFIEPTALDWLFAWHEWLVQGRAGGGPHLPAHLAGDLADEDFGLQPGLLRALGIDGSTRRPRTANRQYGLDDIDPGSAPRSEHAGPGTGDGVTAVAAWTRDAAAVPAAGDGRRDERSPQGRSRYNDLVVTVMRLDPEHPIESCYFAMRFPGRWKALLRGLRQVGGDDGRINLSSLNDAIVAVVPDCVVALPYAERGNDDQDWLLAYDPVDPAAIFRVVAAWVRAQKADREQIASTISQLSAADLSWSAAHVGPDVPMAQLTRLIPMEIAARLSRSDAQVPHGNLRFVRCPTATGAELVSWPPQRVEDRMPFSVTIAISLQTIPTSNELLVYLSFGVRRWLPVSGRLATNVPYTVYLAPAFPYLDGLPHSPHLTKAKIRLARVPQESGRVTWLPQWDHALAEILDRAGCLDQLPDPQYLVAEPLKFLQEDGNAAVVAYRNGMLPWHAVSEGLSVADRDPLMSWVIGELTPHLRAAEPLPRENCTIYKGLGAIAKGGLASDILRDAVGPRLTVELFTSSDRTTQHALDHLERRLDVRLPQADDLGEAEILINLGWMTLGVRRRSLPGIRLDLGDENRRSRPRIEAQVDLIAEQLDHATHPTIALVEIPHQEQDKRRSTDADLKFVLRHALLRAGRLSQFATTGPQQRAPRVPEGREPADADRDRISYAVDDLFRQLGVRPADLPPPAPHTLNCHPALLAVRLFNRTGGALSAARQVPVAVLADPTGHRVMVRTPATDWQPLHAGLLDIGRIHVGLGRTYGVEDTMRFVDDAVHDAIARYPDTLLLTHAQNLRPAWRFLTNSQIEMDVLEFGNGSRQPIAALPGLRHVRVRTAEGGETPECYGTDHGNIGHATGLWRYLVPRLFGSTTGKPATYADASKNLSKIVATAHDDGLTSPNPRARVWNSQFVELLVAGIQDGDQPEHWAALAHDLRRAAAPYSRGTTALPWPLHLAKQIEEYLL